MHDFATNTDNSGELLRGVVSRISHEHPEAGIARLHFEDGKTVFVEAGSGLRCLAGLTGSLRDLYGKELVVATDFLNVMKGAALAEVYDGI